MKNEDQDDPSGKNRFQKNPPLAPWGMSPFHWGICFYCTVGGRHAGVFYYVLVPNTPYFFFFGQVIWYVTGPVSYYFRNRGM